MPKFIVSALPGLLLGLIVGFGLARMTQGDDDDGAERDKKLAKVCLSEAKKVLLTAERSPRGRGGPERPSVSKGDKAAKGDKATQPADAAARAERTIQTTLKRARTEKTWSVAHGKMAERMFPRLSPEAAAELSKKILAAVESGELTVEANAWLPEKK